MKARIHVAIFLCIWVPCACKQKQDAGRQAQNTQVNASADHAELAARLFPKPKVSIRTVGIYLYDGYSALDAMGPYSVLTHLMGTHVFFIASKHGLVTDGNGLKVQVDTSIDQVKQLDLLLVPGGLKETYQQTKDERLLNWVRSIDSNSTYTTSVCTGAWILGAAGLLKDKQATTHWYGKKILAEEYGARVTNTRYTHAGKYWTSAGISAGIDMSLALINAIVGEDYTKVTMLDLEYDPQPPFKGGSEFNSDKSLVEAMRIMYDSGLDAAMHPAPSLGRLNIANQKDLVCRMPVNAAVTDTADYAGKVYGFCSKRCKEEFKRNPQTYLSVK